MPISGVENPAPFQRYCSPTLSIETRILGKLLDDHVRIEMIYAGICGTDLHFVETDPCTHYVKTSAPASIPSAGRVLGHEGVGRVISVGKAVSHIEKGAMVAFASIVCCMHCDACRRGDFNQCLRSSLLGMERDGLFGTIVDVQASLVYDISAMAQTDTDLKAVSCLEPAGVALLACEKARVTSGDRVVVFGGGPIGIYCAMLCRLILGAARVVLVEPMEKRRDLARNWCDAVYDVSSFLASSEHPVDVLIEASGHLDNVTRSFKRVGPNGRVILLGRSGDALRLDAVDHMITQGISVSGSRGRLGGPFAKIMALYRAKRLPLASIVTMVADSLNELPELLCDNQRIINNECKVLVRIGSASMVSDRS